LIDFARQHKLEHHVDPAGNLLILKPATKGMENRKIVVLQSHLDMVCEKNNATVHDFEIDPIQPVMDGSWIKASGTTLGADDGIGIASQMAILASKTIQHGPLECLFTVDEETGLSGAMALQPGFFKGSVLLNLDSEDEGELFIGCAGGIDTVATFRYKTRIYPSGHLAVKIKILGLKGGHSGDEIHKSPGGNSNKILNRFLWNAERNFDIRIAEFDGGNLRNAIPREATAIIAVPEKKYQDLIHYFNDYKDTIQKELQHTEPELRLVMEETGTPEVVMNKKTQKRLLSSLYACPHGVMKWSDDLQGLVETSTNLASVKFRENNIIEITTSQRSSIESAKRDIADRVCTIFESLGAKVKHSDGYPGWKPNPDSEIVRLTAECYLDLFQTKPVIRAIHAGLECGLFLNKYPHLDMISFGPTIKGAHSPDERLHIESTSKYWKLLLEVLGRISEEER
jgi:dipeptidase D